MADFDALADSLRPHYSRFLAGVGDDVLLTAHSHQAWPDVSREAQIEAWDDAARLIDDKWDKVFGDVLVRFRRHVANRLGSSRPEDITIGQNSHELVYRLSTCFLPDATVLTTDSEFHALRRQLGRFREAGANIIAVPVTTEADPDAGAFSRRFIERMRDARPTWVALSQVIFTTSRTLDLDPIVEAAAELEIPVLIDAYHAFNARPMNVDAWPGAVFVTSGGYKYAEAGEGCCFMQIPKDAESFRPIFTGWFSDFANLASRDQTIRYGAGGARFMGSTFDPTAFYRAVRVFEFMDEMGLDTQTLRRHSLAQTALLISMLETMPELEIATPQDERRGAFVAVRSAQTHEVMGRLKVAGLRCDSRGDLIRFGAAPFTTSADIEDGMARLRAAL